MPPVIGDFNGDGILDVAVGPFLPALSPTFETGVGILLGQGDGSFELAGFQITGPYGWNVTQLVAADFNNDGKLDVAAAVAKYGEPTVVELLLGNGDGTLQPTTRLTELRNAGNLTAADFNRDGNMDLIYTDSSSNTLKVALGHGNGTFEAPASTTISGGLVFVADMDGDAVPDVILASFSSLEFHRGLGDGSFDTPITLGFGFFGTSLAIHDFDGDGNRDVAVAVSTHLNIYSGNGDGTFDAPLQKTGGRHDYIVAADFNSDGRPDLATSDPVGGRVSVFLNDGVGGFADGVRYEGVYAPAGLLTGDFDRDGHIDLATFGFATVISVLPGFGDGTFASAVRYSSGLSGNLFSGPQDVLTADVNRDTHTDAVIVFTLGEIVTELGNGDGTFQSAPVPANPTLGSIRTPLLADLNNDGLLDVVGAAGSAISIALGTGDFAFTTSDVSSPGGTAVVRGDFNQDGRLDLAAFNGGNVSIYLTKADGTFPTPQNALHYATGGNGRSIVTGDFNGDSRLDLAVANGTFRTVSLLLGNADGTFAAALNIPVGTVVEPTTGISAQAVKAGDFNSDGRLDLVVLGGFADGLVLPGNGDGTFGAGTRFTTTAGVGGGLTFGFEVAVGDFNADGKLDIVAAQFSHNNFFIGGGGLSVLLGNGDFTFQGDVTYADRSSPRAMTVGDFNQDGRLDIASANINNGYEASGLVSILLGNADGTFQTAVDYPTVGANPRSITAGDLNADGILDLVVVNQTNDTAILLGNANGTFQPALNYFTPSSGSAAGAIGDLNGDGRADVVAGNSLLFGNGDGTFPNRRLFTYLPAFANGSFFASLLQDVAAGDVNGDGNVDLAVSDGAATAILFGNGNGSFLPPLRLAPSAATGLANTSNRVRLVDMDGDGNLDLVTLHKNLVQAGGAVAVWRNDGSGAFSAPLVRNVPIPDYDFFGQSVDLEMGDLNGDSFVDVVVTDGDGGKNIFGLNPLSGGVSVMLGIGDGSLAQPVRYLVGPGQGASRVTLGDMNRDGRPEIVTLTSPLGFGSSRSAVAVFTNNGDGSFGPARIYDHGGYGAAGGLATGDFNSDGAADIIVSQAGGTSADFSIIFAGDGPLLVTDAPVTVTGTNLNPSAGLPFAAIVATFIDANPFGIASDFTATINWGDGQSSTGSVRDDPLGGFEVSGSHTYATGGAFTTTVTVRETGEGTHVGNATARVSTTDQPLTATGVTLSATEDLPFTGVVATFTDADPNGSASDFGALVDWGDGKTSTGVIATNAGGGFTIIGTHSYANPGFFPVVVNIRDIGGSSATANSSAQVAQHINQSPVAINNSYRVNEDAALTVFAAQGILVNDTDVDGDTLSALLIATPAHGTLAFSDNGSFAYVPNANFFGADSFTYKANDGSADSNLATVNITIHPVNDTPVAVNDTATTDEDSRVVVKIVANDSDLDGTIDPATVTITAQPMHGSLQVDPVTGASTYTPALNFFGFDSFRYRVKDFGGLASNIATVSITVNPLNDVPVAISDTYLVKEDTARTVTAAKGLQANDTDIDGGTLTVTPVLGPAHGTLTLNPDGAFTYIPAENYFGSDSFLYRVGDGLAESAPALVLLTILPANDAPVIALAGHVAFSEGTALGRVGSFSDADPGDSWTATVDYGDGSEVQGLVLLGSTFALDHAFADSGAYFTTVKIVDRDGAIGSATFEVVVQNLAATVDAGTDQAASEGALVNVATTFLDPGTLDTHTVLIDWGDGTGPSPASITETAGAGTFSASHVYADNGNYLVTLTLTDDEGAVGSDMVLITVGNLSPVLVAGNDRTVSEGVQMNLTAAFSDAGLADTHNASIDWGDGAAPELARVNESMGSGTILASHGYANNGVYTVSVKVTDDDGASAVDTFVVTVANSAPLVDGGPDRTVNEGDIVSLPTFIPFELSGPNFGLQTINRLSGSFMDIGALDTHTAAVNWGDGTEAAALVLERQFGPQSAPAGVSGVTLSSHRYGDNGMYTVLLSTLDNDGGLGFDNFKITVLNVAPKVGAGADGQTGVGVSFDLTASFDDPGVLDGHTAVIDWGDGVVDPAVVNSAAIGGRKVGTVSGSHRYASGGNFTARVIVTDDDGGSGSDSLLVSVSDNPDNNPPIANGDKATTNEDTPVVIDVVFNDTDADNAALTAHIVNSPVHGALSLNLDGTYTYTPALNYLGPDSFTYRANDGQADSNVARVDILVTALNDAPTLEPIADAALLEGQSLSFQLAALDVDGDALSYSLIGVNAGAGASVNPSGQFSFTALDGDSNYPFTLRVSDADSFAERSFNVTVANVAPTLSMTGAPTVLGGTPHTVNLSATDPGEDSISAWMVNWGDGVTDTLSGTVSQASHLYSRAGGAFTIQASATDEDGSYNAAPLAVSVTPDLLEVQSFTSTATGFKVRFDHAFDPATISLFDGAGGPADVQIKGDLVGNVAGSVLFDADGRGFGFIRTGGMLQFDSYSVKLGSGAFGFHDAISALDGNDDGTPGDDYLTRFDFRSTGAGVLSLPDFMRGPGQPVDVPATGKLLPVTFNSPGGMRNMVFTVDYNPALLAITGASAAAGVPSGSEVRFETELLNTGKQRARITVILPGQATLAAGATRLVELVANVPASARYGSKQVLDIQVASINGSAALAAAVADDDALHVVGYFGDTSGNATYTTLDGQKIQRVLVKLDSGFAAWANVDPLMVADITGDGRLNSLDASRVLQEVSYLSGASTVDRLEIPPIPHGIGPISFSGPDPVVDIPRDLVGAPGQVVTLPVRLDTAAGLESVQLRIGYDPSQFELVQVRRGTLTADFGWFVNGNTPGQIKVDMTNLSALQGGSGTLLNVDLRVLPGATPGVAWIDLQYARLNDGHLTLNTEPQVGGDASDGSINIRAHTPVAAPATLAVRYVELPLIETLVGEALLADLASFQTSLNAHLTAAAPLIDFGAAPAAKAKLAAFTLATTSKPWLKDYLNNAGQATKVSPNLGLRVAIPTAALASSMASSRA